MPVSAGRCVSSLVNASSPPADAPMPTIGKAFEAAARDLDEALRTRLADDARVAPLVLGFCRPRFK